jgi:hypothetical protein
MSLFLNATVHSMDECQTLDELERLGRRLKHEQMDDQDREILQGVYRECRDAIKFFNGEPIQ